MCDKKTSSIVHAQQASRERIAELMLTAEKELGAFYEAVFRRYGLKEAKKSAQDWIETLETMDWAADSALPNWHQMKEKKQGLYVHSEDAVKVLSFWSVSRRFSPEIPALLNA
jgi:hypothetical protein